MDVLNLNTLTEAYNRLVETQNALKEAAQKIEADFKDTASPHYFSNPIGYKTTLDEIIKDSRRIFTSFVVFQINKGYKNLKIDETAIQKFVEDRQTFNANEIIKYIWELYADEDGITLKQIRATCGLLLPYGTFGDSNSRCRAQKPEQITKINATGIELRIHGQKYEQRERVSVVLKLVDIVLRGAKPSKAEGRMVELGETYKDDKIKSLRYFKNNTLKVLFHKAEDCEKVKFALFGEEIQDSCEKTVEEHVKNMNLPESTGQHIIDAKMAVETYLENGAEKEGSQ